VGVMQVAVQVMHPAGDNWHGSRNNMLRHTSRAPPPYIPERRDARMEAATRGPRPAPTTISTTGF
jgi:hypothetical protein